ncbi:Molybdopterin synthase catalytic subunit 2 [Trichinella nativa]|uniref:Molybdopterin synthase catalytic subunit 2 n=1 Tax=Trichinella nativa TaxID=6335 RepID=A0A0V1KX18_9BILA|nr:Molybdopterin synthase catalytic subunit 2 [Trichinella nativa]
MKEMLEFDTGNWILLTEDMLNLESAVDFVSHEENGAVSVFVGKYFCSVRKSSDQVDVAYLAYEAYESMACKIFVNICSEIRKKWPTIHRICVHHRLGNVAVKEKSVIVAASAPHRAETLDAVKFAIDEIKKTVPIWKKILNIARWVVVILMMLSFKVGVLAVGLPVCPKGPAVFVPHFAFAKFNAHRIQALVVVVAGRCGAYSLFFPLVNMNSLILICSIFAIAIQSSLGQISATAFDTEEACRDKCFGERDNGCLRIQPLGQWICRCQSGYYSRRLSCERECENNMYWSLFTTGECVEADTSFTGSCQLTCAFRLRIWTTVFIIILFASAVSLTTLYCVTMGAVSDQLFNWEFVMVLIELCNCDLIWQKFSPESPSVTGKVIFHFKQESVDQNMQVQLKC